MKKLMLLLAVILVAGCIDAGNNQTAATHPTAATQVSTTAQAQELSAKVLSYEIQPDGKGLMKVEISRAGSGEAKYAAVIVQTYDSFGKDVWYLGFPSAQIAGGEKKIVEASIPASAAGKVKSWKIIKMYFENR